MQIVFTLMGQWAWCLGLAHGHITVLLLAGAARIDLRWLNNLFISRNEFDHVVLLLRKYTSMNGS